MAAFLEISQYTKSKFFQRLVPVNIHFSYFLWLLNKTRFFFWKLCKYVENYIDSTCVWHQSFIIDPNNSFLFRIGNPTNMLNPISSARLRSSISFSFMYGKVKINNRNGGFPYIIQRLLILGCSVGEWLGRFACSSRGRQFESIHSITKM